MMTFGKYLILVFFVALVPCASVADIDDSALRYDDARQAYYNHEYPKAEDIFFNLSQELGDKNAYLYYNLGNTYFNMGKIGRALQYYEKARLYLPRYTELQQNLALARSKVVDETNESFSDYLLRTFYFWSGWISFYEFQFALVVFTILFWLLVIVRRLRHKPFVSHTVLVLALFYGYFVFGCHLKTDQNRPQEQGIVLVPEVEVKASYLEKEKPIFILHEGTKVRVIDGQNFGEKNQWLKIALPEGQKGWVKSNTIGRI